MSSVVESGAALSMAASRALGERLGDTPEMARLRSEGAAAASVMRWPDPRSERPWKYLDVTSLDLSGYRPALDAVTPSAERRRNYPDSSERSGVFCQENGEAVLAAAEADGLRITSFEAADGRQRSLVAEHLGTLVPPGKSRFTALHYAFLRGGALIEVAPNVEVKLPVRVLRSLVSGGQFAAPHTLIVTGANSRVTVIEEYTSGDGDILAAPVVEVFPGPGAEVWYTAVHRWGVNTRSFGEQRTVTQRDSAFHALQIALGGRVVKGHVESSLEGRGSSSELLGLGFGTAEQHLDFYTLQDHIGPDTRSDLLFKSALKGRSRAVYYGVTRVGLGANNADANQENRNLLLSREAKADSDPVLEILTSNVIRCSHGATAGPVDEEQLYYLQTRGISRPDAESMLVRAFLGQVLGRVPDDTLRAELETLLDERLGATA